MVKPGHALAHENPALEGIGEWDHAPDAAGAPKHELLRRYLAKRIASGQLPPGTALPTEWQLAEGLSISRSTVRQALASLEREQLVRRVHGKGTFVREPDRERSRALDVFALVLPEAETGFYPSLLRSFEEASAVYHQRTLLCCSDNNVEKQGNIILQLLDHRVAGVALVPAMPPPLSPPYHVRQLHEHGIPVVFCHRGIEGCSAPLLGLPFQRLGASAGEAFLRHGHRRVGFFSMQRSVASDLYESSLRSTMVAGGGALVSDAAYHWTGNLLNLEDAEASIQATLERMLRLPERVTGIFTTFDSLAERLYLTLMRLGVRVPEDISIISVGGMVRGSAMQQLLTAVTVDERQVGRQAAEFLQRMRLGELPLDTAETRIIASGFSEGRTLAAPGPG